MSILVPDKNQEEIILTISEVDSVAELIRILLELEELYEQSNENIRDTDNTCK